MTEQEKARKEQEEILRKQQEEFQKLLETPLPREEGEELLSKIDIQKAQLSAVRFKVAEQLAGIDAQIAQAEYDRTIIIHRILIGGSKEAPGAGEEGK